ncbi:MAG: aspartate kinase [Erysipelotrichales bacterium]|nr:aspartate kinase [Erysipelotrichales bacterium]
MKVCKFGGSSMASAEQIKKITAIILSDPARRLIIVSAPGKRYPEDEKVTDLLIQLANQVLGMTDYQLCLDKIITRFKEIIHGLSLSANFVLDIENDLKERIKKSSIGAPKFMDLIKATGEDLAAKVLAEYLKSLKQESEYINPWTIGMLLSDQPGNARLLPTSYKALSVLKDIKTIGVIPGFFGFNEAGEVVTFARGGSDITGSIISAAVDAEIYENYTDVDSVYVADPKIIKKPLAIAEITYREMRELSYAGFTVLHEETLEPIHKKGIPIIIKNTNNPNMPGTMILPEYKNETKTLSGIAGQKGFASIYLSKYLMNREIGFGRKLLQILEDEHISFDHTPSGIDNISVIIDSDQLNPSIEEKLLFRLKEELKVDHAAIDKDLAVIMVVGEYAMKDYAFAKVSKALETAEINVKILSQSAFGVSLMVGIATTDLNKAIKAIYNVFYS